MTFVRRGDMARLVVGFLTRRPYATLAGTSATTAALLLIEAPGYVVAIPYALNIVTYLLLDR